MDKNSIITKILEAGLKNTRPRINIIDILENGNELLSAQQIYDKLRESKVRVNLSTVYRSLEKLTEYNIINKVSLDKEKQALYEYNREIHHHFLICKNCNKIKTIYSCPLEDYEVNLEKKTNFLITGHKIEFYGYCKECQKKLNKDEVLL